MCNKHIRFEYSDAVYIKGEKYVLCSAWFGGSQLTTDGGVEEEIESDNRNDIVRLLRARPVPAWRNFPTYNNGDGSSIVFKKSDYKKTTFYENQPKKSYVLYVINNQEEGNDMFFIKEKNLSILSDGIHQFNEACCRNCQIENCQFITEPVQNGVLSVDLFKI